MTDAKEKKEEKLSELLYNEFPHIIINFKLLNVDIFGSPIKLKDTVAYRFALKYGAKLREGELGDDIVFASNKELDLFLLAYLQAVEAAIKTDYLLSLDTQSRDAALAVLSYLKERTAKSESIFIGKFPKIPKQDAALLLLTGLFADTSVEKDQCLEALQKHLEDRNSPFSDGKLHETAKTVLKLLASKKDDSEQQTSSFTNSL